MEASVPKPHVTPPERSLLASLRSISSWFVMNAGAHIARGCACYKDTAQSSCQAEFHSINETTKLIWEYCLLLLLDLNIQLTRPVEIKNDIHAIQWSKGTTTKKMQFVDLCKKMLRENIHNNVIQVSHITGKANISNIFAKKIRDTTHYLFLRDLFMILLHSFSTQAPSTGSTWTMSYKSALSNLIQSLHNDGDVIIHVSTLHT